MMPRRLPLEGGSPDLGGQDLEELLASLLPSAQAQQAHSQGQMPAQMLMQMMQKRRLTPSVSTTESVNNGLAGAAPAFMRGV